MTFFILIVAVFWLAYSNGANDNFKGVATLYGSDTLGFNQARTLTTVVTFAGSILSILLAGSLVHAFSGKGLVPDALTRSGALLASVGLAGAITILIATFIGMPTSTTHALTGALAGAALASGAGVSTLTPLWNSFFLPLLVSPILAIVAAVVLYPMLHHIRRRCGVTRESCLCLGDTVAQPAQTMPEGALSLSAHATGGPSLTVATQQQCAERYTGRVVGIGAQSAVDASHILSGAAVSFARSVKDTPKVAALLLAAGVAGVSWTLAFVAIAMALGGWLSARKVAETMSHRITSLNTGQGLTGNLITAALVLGASRFGVPVSTTHVSCGAIFGIGVSNGTARWSTISRILLTWITTLPFAAVLGAAFYAGFSRLGN